MKFRRSIGFVEFQRVNVLRLLIDDSHSRTERFIKKNERARTSLLVPFGVPFLFYFHFKDGLIARNHSESSVLAASVGRHRSR